MARLRHGVAWPGVVNVQRLGVIGGLSSENPAFTHCVKQGTQTWLTYRHFCVLCATQCRAPLSKLSPSMTPILGVG